MKKIVHLITGLYTGGAEMMLLKLCRQTKNDGYSNIIVSMIDIGPLGKILQEEGYTVYSLGLNRGKANFQAIYTLFRILKQEKPDILQTWMYHADLLGSLVNIFFRIPLIWTVHYASINDVNTKMKTKAIIKICSMLSRKFPKKIVYCSESARKMHEDYGYCAEKSLFIPNGFDVNEFTIRPSAKNDLCREIGIEENSTIIGMVARFDPIKNHQMFFYAMSVLQKKFPDIQAVLCGDNITYDNENLLSVMPDDLDKSKVHLLGRRDDMKMIFPAFDLHCLTSDGEAFPNAIGEAMACGVICIATNVGDCAQMIGDTGEIINPGAGDELILMMTKLLSMSADEWRMRGLRARKIIVDNYSMNIVKNLYEDIYKCL